MTKFFSFFRTKSRFVWRPALDLSDPHIMVALLPYSMN
jgi:hypothetical protein